MKNPSKRPISLINCLLCSAGSVILAFGLYNVHSVSQVTEGGILGLTLLMEHWLGLSPAVSSAVFNVLCYALGIWIMGRQFILYSVIACGSFSLSYAVFERFPPLWPELSQMPLAAAVLGAVFVGVGVSLCVRTGGAPFGDDSLAMALAHITGKNIALFYFIADVAVIGLSLSYIPLRRIAFSFLTVLLSDGIISLLTREKKNADS